MGRSGAWMRNETFYGDGLSCGRATDDQNSQQQQQQQTGLFIKSNRCKIVSEDFGRFY